MSQERIEAAAKAFYGDAYEDVFQADKSHALDQINVTLAAVDEVMFSDEAMERAARAAYNAHMEDGDTAWEVFERINSSYLDYWRDQAKAVAEALRNGKAE